MVLPLPSALTEFSKVATQAIEALDAIQQAIQNPQAVIQQNVANAATLATTSIPGDLGADVPGFVTEHNTDFVSGIVSPQSLDVALQQVSATSLFGTGSVTGVSVDGYLDSNVRLGDVLPSQQLYSITQGLSVSAMFSDPLQAYAHVGSGSQNVRNLCDEAADIIFQIQNDIDDLLTVQLSINYAQYASMGPAFFLTAAQKIAAAIAQHGILCAQLRVRGQFDAGSSAALCALLDDVANFVMFANTKTLQFDRLRKDITNGLTRLRQIGRELAIALGGVANFIGDYAKSVLNGKLFQSLQGKVCPSAGEQLNLMLKDAQAFSTGRADDKSKADVTFKIAGVIQSIKAFMCTMSPSSDVSNPSGPFSALHVAYGNLAASIAGNNPADAFSSIEAQVDSFTAMMGAGVILNNVADLAAAAATLLSVLVSISAQVTAISTACGDYKTVFVAQTQADPLRVVGPLDLYDRIGADNSRSIALTNAGDTTAVKLSGCTTLGQLAESLKETIDTLPDGNERDKLILLYSEVVARHRAIILSMDFTRREDVRAYFAPSSAETNRQLVNKVVKTYSGYPRTAFDPVYT